MKRRQALRLLGGLGLGAGIARAADNTILGYGVVTGTNLHEQDLDPLMTSDVVPSQWEYASGGSHLSLSGDELHVSGPEESTALDVFDAAPQAVREAEAVHDLSDTPVAEVTADLRAIESGALQCTYHDLSGFFERVTTGQPRPYTVDALRGDGIPNADVDLVGTFTQADASDPEAVIEGLVGGFRRHTYYDVPRYMAGAVKYNVLFGAYDPREWFEDPVDFESLLAADGQTGMFCNELTARSLEALHAVPGPDQTVPVVGTRVSDWRHKHVYTAISSVLRPDDDSANESGDSDADLELATTFVDYTYSTLYDDFYLTWLTGDGLEAYDTRHRADWISWVRE